MKKSRWITEVTVSAIAFVAILVLAKLAEPGSGLGLTRVYLLAEAVLFALAFLPVALLGGPGRVLALGVALGVGGAVASAILLGEDCSDDFLCLSPTPGEAFVLGLLAALVLYPGWALGAGVGALRRHSKQPSR